MNAVIDQKPGRKKTIMGDTRLTIWTTDKVRKALRLEAAKRDCEMSDLVHEVLTEALKDSLAEVEKRATDVPSGQERRSKR